MPGQGLGSYDHSGFFNDAMDRPLCKARVFDHRGVPLANEPSVPAGTGKSVAAPAPPPAVYPAVPQSLKVLVEVPPGPGNTSALSRTVDIYREDPNGVLTSAEVYVQGANGNYTVTIFTVEFMLGVNPPPGIARKNGPYDLI